MKMDVRSMVFGLIGGAVLVLAPAAFAGGGPGGPEGRDRLQEVAEAAGLSESQRDQVEALWLDHMEAQIDGRAEIEKGKLALRRILEADQVDEKAAWKAFDQLSTAEKAIGEDRLQTMIAIRKTMSADQWRIVAEMHRERGHGPPQGMAPPDGAPEGTAPEGMRPPGR